MAAIKTAIDNGTVTVATPGIIYCGAQGGDQGTRALVNNLYSDYYVNDDGTSYNANSANNVQALTLLQGMVNKGSLSANASFAAADELQAFANQTCAVTFCWNYSNYTQYAEQTQFTPSPWPPLRRRQPRAGDGRPLWLRYLRQQGPG